MYFLTILASLSESTMVPRASRTNLAVRLIMPCRLPWACTLTLPVAVILKRFLAPLLVFSLGILLLLMARPRDNRRSSAIVESVRSRHGMPRRAAWMALHRANRSDVQRVLRRWRPRKRPLA